LPVSWGSLTKLKIRRPLLFLPTGYLSYIAEHYHQRLCLLSKRNFLDRVVRDSDEPPIPLHSGPGQPEGPITDVEPFWEQATHLQLQYSQLVILIFSNCPLAARDRGDDDTQRWVVLGTSGL
jgi:hypothetical protein